MKQKLIYLASPYSQYPHGRDAAFAEACRKAGELMEKGYFVFCPIAHSHPIEDHAYKERKHGDWWLRQDFAILERCDELWVYQMPGWNQSYGVAHEIAYADNLGIPIKYIQYEQKRVDRKAA